MSLKRIFVELSAISTILSGCLPFTIEERQDSVKPEQVESFDQLAEDYFIEDLPCQEDDSTYTVGAQDVHVYGGGATQPRSHSFQGFSSVESLQGPGIAASLYNFHQQSKCTRNAEGTETCENGSRVVKPARSFKICRTGGGFARASVEGVALSSMASLDVANTFYKAVPQARSSLKSASVIVLPIVEKQISEVSSSGETRNLRSIMTDNLAYTSNFDGRPAFVVFPKSRNAVNKGRWVNLNLWELPWGMAHEFGHHVFRSHSGIEKLPGSIASVHGIQFDMPIHSIDFEEKKQSNADGFFLATRTIGPEQYFSSVNEGFADLFAFYALGESTTLTAGVDCFEQNRDITSNQFANGTPKKLTEEVLEIFGAGERILANSCEGPDFQDSHSIGAVIAHGIMRLYKVSGTASAHERAGWLLTWADSVGATIRAGGRSAVTLENLVSLAVKVVAQSDNSLSTEQCRVLQEVFPAFEADWNFSCR